MAAKNLGSTDQRILDAVMPKGQVLKMPDDLVQDLALRTPRFESPSSIRTYLGCPLYWYVERYAPIEGEVSPPGYAGVIGSFVHRVLEVFFSEPKSKRSLDLLERIFRYAMDAIKQGNLESGVIEPSLQEEFDYVIETAPKSAEEGGWGLPNMTEDKVIGAFFKRSREAIENAKDFYAEPGEIDVIATESWGRFTVNDVTIRFKIDRTDDTPSGVSVVDYKTGRAPDMDNEDGMECLRDENGEPILDENGNKILLLADAYIAMGIYALGILKGGVEGVDTVMPSNVQLHYLKENLKYIARVRPSHLDMVAKMVDRVTREMLEINETGEIIASPEDDYDENNNLVPSGPCTWCSIKSVCPARDGRDGDWTDLRKEFDF